MILHGSVLFVVSMQEVGRFVVVGFVAVYLCRNSLVRRSSWSLSCVWRIMVTASRMDFWDPMSILARRASKEARRVMQLAVGKVFLWSMAA